MLRALSRVVASFSDEQEQLAARRALEETHYPKNISTTLEKWEHNKVVWVPHPSCRQLAIATAMDVV